MSSPDSTPDAILHLATLHLLSQAGFASTSKAASLTLSSVVAQYFKTVARACVDHANLAGRSKPGAYDVVESLKELGYGFRLDELYEYGLDSRGGVVFQGEALDQLSDYLDQGRTVHEPIARLRLVPNEELDDEDEAEGNESDSGSDSADMDVKEDHMDIDEGQTLEKNLLVINKSAQRIRFRSPDFSWLPPLPDTSGVTSTRPSAGTDLQAGDIKLDPTAPDLVSAPSSIADRYRTRIAFTTSSLSAQSNHTVPPPPITRRIVTAPPSSLASLIQTYTDTRGEMSVAIRPNGYRLQALDLLRRQVATPEDFAPTDSLSGTNTVPGPKITPIAVPPHPVSVNPDQSGVLSQLVHSIHSGNLPPELRERLTSLRPPLPQKRDGGMMYYGPVIRGADKAALLRHQGKQPDASDEVYAQATWDVGPRGAEKFSRGTLPRGKKVIKNVDGEDIPRQEKRKPVSVDLTSSTGGAGTTGTSGSGTGGGRTTLRLKLGDSVSPAPPASAPAPGTGGQLPTPPLATPGGTTIRLRVPGSQEPTKSTSPAPAPPQGSEGSMLFSNSTPPVNGQENGPISPSPGSSSQPLPLPPAAADTLATPTAATGPVRPTTSSTSEVNAATATATAAAAVSSPGPVQPPLHRSSRLSASPHVSSAPLPSLPSDRHSRSPRTRTPVIPDQDVEMMDVDVHVDMDRKPSPAALGAPSEAIPDSMTQETLPNEDEGDKEDSTKREPL